VASAAPPAGAPVVSGTLLIVPLSTRGIAAHRVSDGALQWNKELRAEQSLAADGERVYVASEEAIHALTAASGSVAWRVPMGGKPTAPPLAHGGWVIAAAAGELVAIRATDGVVMWRSKVGPVEFRPSLDGELLVASVVDGRIVALDVRDGSARWTTDLRASPGEPFVIGGRVYVGTKDRYFYSLLSSSGRVEDHRKIAAEILGRVAVNDKYVYFAALDNTVRAFLRRGGSEVWHQGVSYRPGSGPVLVGEVVIVPGYIEAPLPAFSAATGAAAGSVPFGGLLVALPVFTTLPDGRNVVFALTGGLENKWMVSLQVPSLVAPIVAQPLTALPGVAVPIPLPPGS
jgi:outer membrane protein assembly factor BamB